jgi:hypothetical protein
MSSTVHVPAPTPAPPDPLRGTARLVGALYLLTFVSIPSLALYRPLKDHDDFVLGAGSSTGVLWGALSEVVVALAGIATAVVLHPLLRRQSQTAALGLVAARVVETTLILVGAGSLLTVVTLRADVAGTPGVEPATLVTISRTLEAFYDRTFLLSQSLAPVVVDLLLGWLLWHSRLVPRVLPRLAFVGAPLLLLGDALVYTGVVDRTGALAGLLTIPVALFELSLGAYLVARGFLPSSPLVGGDAPHRPGAGRPVPGSP